jgi:hypothetical protein
MLVCIKHVIESAAKGEENEMHLYIAGAVVFVAFVGK